MIAGLLTSLQLHQVIQKRDFCPNSDLIIGDMWMNWMLLFFNGIFMCAYVKEKNTVILCVSVLCLLVLFLNVLCLIKGVYCPIPVALENHMQMCWWFWQEVLDYLWCFLFDFFFSGGEWQIMRRRLRSRCHQRAMLEFMSTWHLPRKRRRNSQIALRPSTLTRRRIRDSDGATPQCIIFLHRATPTSTIHDLSRLATPCSFLSFALDSPAPG